MKLGRHVKIKNEKLKKIRTNLRNLLYQAYLRRDLVGGFESFPYSIIRCKICTTRKGDRILWDDSYMESFRYPPSKEGIYRKYWLCESCYKKMLENIEMFKKGRYFYYPEFAEWISLDEFGLKHPRDAYDFDFNV